MTSEGFSGRDYRRCLLRRLVPSCPDADQEQNHGDLMGQIRRSNHDDRSS